MSWLQLTLVYAVVYWSNMANLGSDDQNPGSSWGFILAAGSAALVVVVKAFVIGYHSTRECYDVQNCGWGWGYFVATGIGAVLVGAAVYAVIFLHDEKDGHQDQSPDERLQCKMSESATEIGATKPMKVLKCCHTFHEECIDYWLKDTSDCPMCTPLTWKIAYYDCPEFNKFDQIQSGTTPHSIIELVMLILKLS